MSFTFESYYISAISLLIGIIVGLILAIKYKTRCFYLVFPILFLTISELALHLFNKTTLISWIFSIFDQAKRIAEDVLDIRKQIRQIPATEPQLRTPLEAQYDSTCDTFFKAQPSLYEQYLDMKKSRPIEEIRNLCKSQALNLLGKKSE